MSVSRNWRERTGLLGEKIFDFLVLLRLHEGYWLIFLRLDGG